MTRTAIKKLISDSTASMSNFMRTVYRRLNVRGMNVQKRTDWDYPGYKHYHGFTFTAVLAWGENALLRVGWVWRTQFRAFTLIPGLHLVLYV